MSFPAIDHHHIWPVVEAVGLQGTATLVAQGTHINTISLGAGPTPETPSHDLGHGHEVIAVAGLDAAAADLVFAVMLLRGQTIDEHHLGGHGIAALDVTDVVALDPSRRRLQFQQLSQILGGQCLLLLPLLGSQQFEFRVPLHQFDQVRLLPLFWAVDLNLAFPMLRQPVLEKLLLRQGVLHQ